MSAMTGPGRTANDGFAPCRLGDLYIVFSHGLVCLSRESCLCHRPD
jgi:hypothetical protein